MALYNNETVSVITPVYNVASVIERTLDSILMQNYKDLEIVLVDDCSKDNSAEIIAKYTAKYPNIKYHKQEKNGGAAVARNTALNLAKGRYVAFLDSDDWWEEGKLKNILFAATGALMSTTALQQGESIPGIAHALWLSTEGERR